MIASAWNNKNISTNLSCFKKVEIIKKPITKTENPDGSGAWNFLIEKGDIKINNHNFF